MNDPTYQKSPLSKNVDVALPINDYNDLTFKSNLAVPVSTAGGSIMKVQKNLLTSTGYAGTTVNNIIDSATVPETLVVVY